MKFLSSYFLISSFIYGSSLPNACLKPGKVAITIDEGPSSQTKKILAELRKSNVKATFHFNPLIRGASVQEIYNMALKDGHEIGFRTAPTRDYGNMNDKEVKEDIKKQIDFFENKTGEKVKFSRSPVDNAMPVETVYNYFVQRKIIQTSYSFCPYDNNDNNPVDNLKEYLAPMNNKQDSFIILLYDQRLGQDGNLKEIIKTIKSNKYEMVTLSSCLEGFKPGDKFDNAYGSLSSSTMPLIFNPLLFVMMHYIM